MFATLLTSFNNGTLTVTINRAEKLNALNEQVFSDLSDVLGDICNNPDIRSAIITGAGDKAFVAGADISEFRSLSIGEGMAMAKRGQEVFQRIAECPKPVVAAVNGFALGGGCELAMACHMRLASDNAKFGQPEVNLGLLPGFGGTQRLVQLIGKGRAVEMMITGNMIDATTALQFGLVNDVVPQDELLSKAAQILLVSNEKPPLAVAAIMKAVNAVYDKAVDGFKVEREAFATLFATEDMKEGTSAFLEKRKPLPPQGR